MELKSDRFYVEKQPLLYDSFSHIQSENVKLERIMFELLWYSFSEFWCLAAVTFKFTVLYNNTYRKKTVGFKKRSRSLLYLSRFPFRWIAFFSIQTKPSSERKNTKAAKKTRSRKCMISYPSETSYHIWTAPCLHFLDENTDQNFMITSNNIMQQDL